MKKDEAFQENCFLSRERRRLHGDTGNHIDPHHENGNARHDHDSDGPPEQ